MQSAKQNILQTLKIIALALILTTGLSIALAWNGPTAAPPGNNTDEPLNTSNNWQTKYGYLSLPKLIDSNDGQTGYYLDPGANSWLYRLYSYDIRSSIFYDQDNTDYYVDPASTSKFNTINLGGVSRSSWPVDTDTDTNTWRPAQTLSVSGQTLSISSGNSVALPSGLSIVEYSGTGCGNCPCGYSRIGGSRSNKYCYESCNGHVCTPEGHGKAMCWLGGGNNYDTSWAMHCVE
ncbi:MAG: hypothetical protein KAV41_00830 [Candidatus Pacebacteria bacterium]|nr:hypothetical protein [Candidatus Paceibacterota bacterium]